MFKNLKLFKKAYIQILFSLLVIFFLAEKFYALSVHLIGFTDACHHFICGLHQQSTTFDANISRYFANAFNQFPHLMLSKFNFEIHTLEKIYFLSLYFPNIISFLISYLILSRSKTILLMPQLLSFLIINNASAIFLMGESHFLHALIWPMFFSILYLKDQFCLKRLLCFLTLFLAMKYSYEGNSPFLIALLIMLGINAYNNKDNKLNFFANLSLFTLCTFELSFGIYNYAHIDPLVKRVALDHVNHLLYRSKTNIPMYICLIFGGLFAANVLFPKLVSKYKYLILFGLILLIPLSFIGFYKKFQHQANFISLRIFIILISPGMMLLIYGSELFKLKIDYKRIFILSCPIAISLSLLNILIIREWGKYYHSIEEVVNNPNTRKYIGLSETGINEKTRYFIEEWAISYTSILAQNTRKPRVIIKEDFTWEPESHTKAYFFHCKLPLDKSRYFDFSEVMNDDSYKNYYFKNMKK